MSTFNTEGSIYIDNFTIGDDKVVEKLKFVGINKLFDQSSRPFAFEEVVSGILGFGPPQDTDAKKRNFMHQLKSKGVIGDLTFAIAMDSRENFKDANI